jgi:hypothetical protein
MQHLRSSLVAVCLLLSGCSAGDAPGTPMIPSGEQPPTNDQQPPANAEAAPVPGPESLPCSGSTTPEEFLQIMTDAVCSQVAVCRCTADVACDGCLTCLDQCRCHGGTNAVCRQQCGGGQQQVSSDWGPTCQAYRDCVAGQGCGDLSGIANPLPVCPSELRPCVAAIVTAVGCNPADATVDERPFAQIPACAKIADLLEQATTSTSQQQQGGDAGTPVPNAG